MSKYECFNEEYTKIINPSDVDASIIKEFNDIDDACKWFESELEKYDIDSIGYVDEVFSVEKFTQLVTAEYPLVSVNNTMDEFGCINIVFNHHTNTPSDPVSYIKDIVTSIFDGDVKFAKLTNGSVDIDFELESETVNDDED